MGRNMTDTKPVLTILVPVKDEEEAVAAFVARVSPILDALDDPAAKSWEILFVDDGSTDTTLAVSRLGRLSTARLRRTP